MELSIMERKLSTALYAIGLSLLLFISASCSRDGFVPRDGDLLFCLGDDSPMSEAITTSTSSDSGVRYDHVALFATIDGIPSVI